VYRKKNNDSLKGIQLTKHQIEESMKIGMRPPHDPSLLLASDAVTDANDLSMLASIPPSKDDAARPHEW
jgi:hypothetical protein